MVERQNKKGGTIEGRGKEVRSRTDLIAFQGGVILSIILPTFHTEQWCIDVFRMSWEVVEFLVWLGKEEGCILAGCNAAIEKLDWMLQQKWKGSGEKKWTRTEKEEN